MAKSLGISLQSDRFAYVLLEGSAKRYTVRKCGEGVLPTDASGLKQLGKAIEDAIDATADHVAVAMPSSGVVLRELGLPFSEREKVMQVLKFEVESDLYHLDIDEVLCDFVEVSDDRATPTLLVSIVPKSHMDTALGLCEVGDWDPETVGLALGGLYNAIGELARSGEEAAVEAYLHLGTDASMLLLLNADGTLRAARSIPLGWRELSRGMVIDADGAVADAAAAAEIEEELSFEIVEGESEKGVKQDKAEPEPEVEEEEEDTAAAGRLFGGDAGLPAGVALEDVLAFATTERREAFQRRLANEVRRGLEAMEAGTARLHLMGAVLPGLADSLQQRLRREVAPLDLGFAADDGGFADPVALGMALRGLGISRSPMNFRQEEYRYARGLERVEGPLTLALVGIIAFMVVDMALNFNIAKFRKLDAGRIYREADAKVATLNQRVREDEDYPDEWIIKNDLSGLDVAPDARIGVLASRVNDAKRDLDALMGEADIEMPPSCLEAWRLVMQYLDGAMGDWDDKWMIESFSMTSFDARRAGDTPYVEVEFGLTLVSENAQLTASRYDLIENGLSRQPWALKAAEIPSTEAADVQGARTAKITCFVRTDVEA